MNHATTLEFEKLGFWKRSLQSRGKRRVLTLQGLKNSLSGSNVSTVYVDQCLLVQILFLNRRERLRLD